MPSEADSPSTTDLSRKLGLQFIALLILVILAFSTRILPLAISPLPFNNDGILESRIASDILLTGDLSFSVGSCYVDMHSDITPVYNVLLAFVSSVTGTSPFDSAQSVVAMLSVVTVIGGYLIALQITSSRKGAMASALFLSLFGTFVYLTGSTWKESLGMALFVLLFYAYMNRSDRRYLFLEAAILLCLPFTHHLVTVIAYLALAYMTAWSWVFALRNGKLNRVHYVDFAMIGIPSVLAFFYYSMSSLDRFALIGDGESLVAMLVSVVVVFFLALVVLSSSKRTKFSLAPLPAIALAIIVVLDFYDPIFPYTQGTPDNILLLLTASCLLVSVAWFGLERLLRVPSRFRTIPLGLLLPVLTLLLFAIVKGIDMASHQIFYRAFDFADLAVAVGISSAVGHFSKKSFRLEVLVVGLVLLMVLISFPFGYATQSLLGMRHDSQEYEMDAIEWVGEEFQSDTYLLSDERLAYDARALYDFEKNPFLPSILLSGEIPDRFSVNIYVEEWTEVGVNDYPRGHPVLDPVYVHEVLDSSNVLYVGGPASNNIIIFTF